MSQLACGIQDDFLNWGSELPGYGARYYKDSSELEEHGLTGNVQRYIGEWSIITNKPYGRGIVCFEDGKIQIGSGSDGNY